jgi:protein-L-isoaspartate(D-aspartate) O-methyltransferase
VITLEISETLARMAKDNLRSAGVMNATVRCADGSRGYSGEAPYDAIVLSGSVAAVPQVLLEQLKVGGRLIAIVGDEPVMRARLYTRADTASWSHADLFDTVAPRLRGFPESERFRF